jgi:ribosomal protein L11 methyltransferase
LGSAVFLFMEYLQFLFEGLATEKKEILIALLSDAGFEGFEESDQSLKAFIPQPLFDQSSFDSIIDVTNVKYLQSNIKKTNWNEKWESDFHPVEVIDTITSKPFAYIRASFHTAAPAFEHDIIVTPKMSFGTGHHATTFLMVLNMQHIDFAGKTVIDFGTGTGVLAILAEKLGAASVVGIDCDDWSIDNAKENLAANNCTKVSVVKAETIPSAYKAEIILANINLNIIAANITEIKAACLPGTELLFSGIMIHDEKKILEVLSIGGLIVREVYKRENWLAISSVNI